MKRIIGTFNSTKEININLPDNTLLKDHNILYGSQSETFTFEGNKIFLSGNIYNKTELQNKYNIQCNSIAELILKLYLNYSFNSIKNINGEYTFVIITHFETIIFRDRHGCGLPVFYTNKYFSTSLSSLINTFKLKKEINKEAIASFLGLGYIPSPQTPLKFIKKLNSGSFLLYKHGVSVTESKLFDFEDFTKQNKEENENFDSNNKKLRELIEKAINLREGEYNNISFLDFQQIVKNHAFKSKNTNISSDYNKNNNIKHHEINNLPKIIKCFEIPFNDFNIIHNYLFFEKLKKSNPDVLFSFTGLDYLFGTNANNISKYLKLKNNKTLKIIKLIKKILNFDFFEKYKKVYLFKIIINRILNIYSIGRNGFTKKQISKLLKSEFKTSYYKYQNSLPVNANNFEDAYITHNYFIDIKQSLNEIETYQMSMIANNFNINLSYPLLDNNIYDILKSVPVDFKTNINTLIKNKNAIKYDKSSDFHLHINQANYLYDINLRKKLYNYMLNSDACKNLFNISFLEIFFSDFEKEIISKKRINKVLYDLSFQFFNLLILNIWWDQFINNKKGNTLQDFY